MDSEFETAECASEELSETMYELFVVVRLVYKGKQVASYIASYTASHNINMLIIVCCLLKTHVKDRNLEHNSHKPIHSL